MDEPGDPSTDRLCSLVTAAEAEAARDCLERFQTAATEDRKDAIHSLRTVADEEPSRLAGLVPAVEPFLTDGTRAVRLSTAKLLVAVAEPEPDAVRPAVDTVADRLADDEEFYFVRARCAETLGYVALEYPEAVSGPETLAELRVGLSFDEPEVREKLAKAIAYVTVGDPDRLRHQVDSLADHLDDERELVRYHLCTALVTVGSEHPETLSTATDALVDRLADESPYVRGRAAEALGVLAESGTDTAVDPEELTVTADEPPEFLTDRLQFARRRLRDEGEGSDLGTVASVREGTDDAVEAITSPDSDSDCPNCGLALPEKGPPMCPRCGAPR